MPVDSQHCPSRLPSSVTRNGLTAVRVLVAGLLVVMAACSSSTNAVSTVLPPAVPPATYTLGGTISGLPGDATGLVLANGATTISVAAGSTSFTFPNALVGGTNYSVNVQTSPTGLTCSVASGSGTVQTANVSSVVVTCSTAAFSIGGSVSGLTAAGLVLQNGTDTVTVPPAATSYLLPAVAETSSYNVTVKTQPAGLNCSVANGSNTMPAHAVSNVNVTCSAQPFTVGGTIMGLTVSGLVLVNGTDTLSVPANASTFTMPTGVAFNSTYAIAVQTHPVGLTCSVSAGSGTMPAANVTSVVVACSDQTYHLSGMVSGLSSSGLGLANGSDTVTVPSGATSYSFTVPYTSSYTVAVQTQPTGLTCSVASPHGTMPAHDVSGVDVTCATSTYSVGGTISGLNRTGLVLANGADTRTVSSNATTFTMPNSVAYGGSYTVTVQTQPRGLTCLVSDGSASNVTANAAITVACTQNVFAFSPDQVNDSVLVYAVDANHVFGTPTAYPESSGTHPAWVTVNGDGTVLYVVDRALDRITWWDIDPATGALSWTAAAHPMNPTNFVATGGSKPQQIVLNAAGTLAFVPDQDSDLISVFDVDVGGDGSLMAWPNSPFPADYYSMFAAGPSSITLHPTYPLMYVTNQYSGSVDTYGIDVQNKDLIPVNSVPTGSGPFSFTLNAAATYAYSGNLDSNAIWEYVLDSTGVLSVNTANNSSGFIAIPTTTGNTNNMPDGVTLDPSGTHVYSANNGASPADGTSVTQFIVDPSTGLLSPGNSVATAPSPSTVMFDVPSGLLYVTNNGGPTQAISSFSIGPAGAMISAGTADGPANAVLNSVAFARP